MEEGEIHSFVPWGHRRWAARPRRGWSRKRTFPAGGPRTRTVPEGGRKWGICTSLTASGECSPVFPGQAERRLACPWGAWILPSLVTSGLTSGRCQEGWLTLQSPFWVLKVWHQCSAPFAKAVSEMMTLFLYHPPLYLAVLNTLKIKL